MVTFQAGRLALLGLLLGLVAACGREQQDWHSAQSADTTEAWQRFIEQHPQSELAAQARLRLAQMAEQRDFQQADAVATVNAYRRFLVQHPNGRWAEQARIRIEAFSLGSLPRIAPQSAADAAATPEARGVRALQLATAAASGAAAGTPADSTAAAQAPAAFSALPASAAPPLESERPSGVPAAAEPAGSEMAQPGEAAQPGDAAQPGAVSEMPPVSDAAPAGTSYGVQLGAFGNPVSADREWQRLQGRFGAQLAGLSPRIVVASTSIGQLYRLQAAASGETQARAICDSLKEQSQSCVPVVPR